MLESVSTLTHALEARSDDEAGRSFQSALTTQGLTVRPPAQTPPVQTPSASDKLAAAVKQNPNAAPSASDLSRPLDAAQALSQNWDKWGLHASHIDFANPPANLPQEAKNVFKYLAANPTLFDAISAGGGGTPGSVVTKANVDAYIKAATGDMAAAAKGAGGTSLWDSATAGLDPASRTGEEAALNAPLANAELITANWHSWGLHAGMDFNNPPADLPPEAKAALKAVGSNPALMQALDSGGSGKANGTITQADVNSFITHATDDAKAAGKSFSDWMAKNPNADDASKALARSATLLMANATLISGADPNQAATTSDSFSAQDLTALASMPGVSPDLAQAASFWSHPGMFAMLDNGGSSPATDKPDGTSTRNNIGGWIGSQAPATSADFSSMLNQAAAADMTAGVDTSKVGNDIFSNPTNPDGTPKYDAQTKAAVLQQLIQTDSVLGAGQSGNLWNGDQGKIGLAANEGSVRRDLEDKINTLSQDPDVTAWQSQNRPAALQSLVGSDSAISGALQGDFNDQIASGKALDSLLGSKDSSGNPVSDGAALLSLASQYQFYADALGTGGQPAGGLASLQGIVSKDSQFSRLSDEYSSQIVSGQELRDKLSAGEDLQTASQEFSGDAAGFAAVLDPRTVSDNASTLQANFSDVLTGQMLGQAPASDITDVIGDGHGGLDDAKIKAVMDQLQAQDPDIFKNADGSEIKPDQITNLIKQVWDSAGRQPAKVMDAIGKLTGDKPTNALNAQYSKGALHLVSAMFSGMTLIGKGAEKPTTPAQIASTAATGVQFAGLMLEGGAKFSKSAGIKQWGAADVSKIEALGKTLGGVANSMTGALGIVGGLSSLASGDKVGAGLNLTGATLNLIAGGSGIADGVISGLGIGDEALTGAIGLAGGVSAGLGALVGIGVMIWQAVEQGKQQKRDETTFYGQIDPVLHQYGITGNGFQPDPPAVPDPGVDGPAV